MKSSMYPGYFVADSLHRYEVLWKGNKRLLISKYLLNYSSRLLNSGFAGPDKQSSYLSASKYLEWGDHIWKSFAQ